jgi:hypothetical protein
MSERNQFIREMTPPKITEKNKGIDNQAKRCSFFAFFRGWGSKRASSSDNLPKSIKVKPIN